MSPGMSSESSTLPIALSSVRSPAVASRVQLSWNSNSAPASSVTTV